MNAPIKNALQAAKPKQDISNTLPINDSTDSFTLSICYKDVTNTVLKPITQSFEAWVDIFSRAEIGTKEGSYFLRGNATKRGDKYLQSADAVILDGDSTIDILTGEITEGAPPPELIHKVLKKHDIQHLIYTSHSHNIKGNRYRVVIPVTLESKRDLVAVVDHIIQLLHSSSVFLNNVSENSCWSQAWYFPRVPEEHVDDFEFYSFDTSAVIDVESICIKAKNSPSTVPAKVRSSQQLLLAQTSETVDLTVLKSLLKSIDASDYNDWIKVGMAIHHETNGRECGLELWDQWSQTSDSYNNKTECEYKWSTFNACTADRVLTIRTLQKMSASVGASLLTTSDEDPIILEMNKVYGVISVGNKVKILKESQADNEGDGISLLGLQGFALLERNKPRVLVGRTLMDRWDFWISHQDRREYKGLLFHPGGTQPGYFNLYKGLGVEAIEGDPALFLTFIETVICKNDSTNFQYLIAWMAHLVQTPEEKVGVAVIIRGLKGTGKGKFLQQFGSLFGSHFMEVANGEHIVGKFNAHLSHLLLLGADEAYWNGDTKAEGVLKNLVTEPKITIERKGIDSVSMDSFMRIVLTTNNDYVVPASGDERRWFVLDIADTYKGDYAYFKAIDEHMDSGGREALLYYLMHYQIPDNIELRQAPTTAGLDEQKVHSLSGMGRWWMDCLLEGQLYGHQSTVCQLTQSFNSFSRAYCIKSCNQHINDHRVSKPVSSVALGKYLRKVVPNLGTSGNANRVYNFPGLDQLRQDFESEIGSFDWIKGC